MKRILICFLLSTAMLFAGSEAYGQAVPKEALLSLIREYSNNDGFEVLKVGGLGTTALKAVINLAVMSDGDPEAREAVKAIKGIRRMAIVDFEDCSQQVRDSFTARLKSLLARSEKLMEVKDDGDTLFMYGVVDKSGSKVKDFVLYSVADSSLICLFGSINLDAVMKIAGQAA